MSKTFGNGTSHGMSNLTHRAHHLAHDIGRESAHAGNNNYARQLAVAAEHALKAHDALVTARRMAKVAKLLEEGEAVDIEACCDGTAIVKFDTTPDGLRVLKHAWVLPRTPNTASIAIHRTHEEKCKWAEVQLARGLHPASVQAAALAKTYCMFALKRDKRAALDLVRKDIYAQRENDACCDRYWQACADYAL